MRFHQVKFEWMNEFKTKSYRMWRRTSHRGMFDVFFLVETWHDSDSVSLCRLRIDGFQVVDRARQRVQDDTKSTNHRGVAAIAMPGVLLSSLNLGVKPASFELLCVRVTTRSSSCVVAVVYRPGSELMKKENRRPDNVHSIQSYFLCSDDWITSINLLFSNLPTIALLISKNAI